MYLKKLFAVKNQLCRRNLKVGMMIKIAIHQKESKIKTGGMTPLTSMYPDLNEYLRAHLSG